MRCDNLYKIGISNNPNKRYHTFLTGNPNIEMLCYSQPVTFAYMLEQKLHKLFCDKSVSGEWFKLNEENVVTLRKLIENLSENDYYTIVNLMGEL